MIHWLAMVPWIVLVLVLLWRVIRLEQRAGRNEAQATWLHECLMERAHRSSLLALSERVAGDLDAVKQLARALGYEWKRTDAKGGWERSAVASVKPDAPYNRAYTDWVDDEVEHMAWSLFGSDRRKADRRKPVPQAAHKSPPKKRRAH